MRKTVLLSLDLFFSVLLISVFIIISSNVQEHDNFDNNIIQNYAQNALLYMDDSLASQNNTRILSDLERFLPFFISYQIRVDYYTNGDNLTNSTVLGGILPNDYVSVKKPFTYGDNFGIANLKLWLQTRSDIQ